MTTATNNGTLPEPDTAGDAKAEPKEQIAEPKNVNEPKNPLNSTSMTVGIIASLAVLFSVVFGMVIRAADTERRSIETAIKVDKQDAVAIATATDLATIKVRMGYMEKNVDSIAQDVKKIAEQKQ